MENNRLNYEEAILFIQRVEKERIVFRNAISKDKFHEEAFDLSINRASFSDMEIVELVEFAIEKKKILQNQHHKMDFF